MKGQFKKASSKPAVVPRQIILPLEEGEEVDPELDQVFQTWRYSSFMIVYNAVEESAMIIDLNGGSFIRHLGSLDEVLAIVGALLTVKVHGQALYGGDYGELEDEEFVAEGMDTMEDIMAMADEPDEPDPTEIYNALKSQFVNELIKPPKNDE